MRVLLTGGAGFIGRAVYANLEDRGHHVRVLDSLRPDVHQGRPPSFDVAVGDVRDAAAVDEALVGVDAVIHLAAKVGLGVDTQDYPDYADCNLRGTAVLLAAMDRAGVRRLVQASSMVVYGPGLGCCDRHGVTVPEPRSLDDLQAGRFDPGCPACRQPLAPVLVDERAPFDPSNAYAISKLGQEQLSSVWARDRAASVVNLRYHNVYGPGLPRNTPYAGVAAIFLSALRRGDPPKVFEDGMQRRDFVHVRDVAAATVSALDIESVGATALNIGSGISRTVGDFATALARATDGPAPVTTGEFRAGDVRHITANSARARTVLSWRPEVDFTAGVAELVGE